MQQTVTLQPVTYTFYADDESAFEPEKHLSMVISASDGHRVPEPEAKIAHELYSFNLYLYFDILFEI